MYICPEQLTSLQNSLTDLQEAIILKTCNKTLEDRELAISEIHYYRSLLEDFLNLSPENQAEIITQLFIVVEELESWMKRN